MSHEKGCECWTIVSFRNVNNIVRGRYLIWRYKTLRNKLTHYVFVIQTHSESDRSWKLLMVLLLAAGRTTMHHKSSTMYFKPLYARYFNFILSKVERHCFTSLSYRRNCWNTTTVTKEVSFFRIISNTVSTTITSSYLLTYRISAIIGRKPRWPTRCSNADICTRTRLATLLLLLMMTILSIDPFVKRDVVSGSEFIQVADSIRNKYSI